MSRIFSVRRLAAAVPSAPRRRARQSSALPRGAAAPPGTVRLGASGDGKVGRFSGENGENTIKHLKIPGKNMEQWCFSLDDLGLCGFHLQKWWIATNMAESNKEKTGDSDGKSWPIHFLVNSHLNNGQEYDQSRDVHHTSGP